MKLELLDAYSIRARLSASIILLAPIVVTIFFCFEEIITLATLDNDNDHSDDPADWIPIAAIPELFPGVPCVVSTSRHHMKQKGNRSPRPRYHVAFQIDTIQSPEEYTASAV